MAQKFLTYEQCDALIAQGVQIDLSEDGRFITVWANQNHGSIYGWNSLAQAFQYIKGAFKS